MAKHSLYFRGNIEKLLSRGIHREERSLSSRVSYIISAFDKFVNQEMNALTMFNHEDKHEASVLLFDDLTSRMADYREGDDLNAVFDEIIDGIMFRNIELYKKIKSLDFLQRIAFFELALMNDDEHPIFYAIKNKDLDAVVNLIKANPSVVHLKSTKKHTGLDSRGLTPFQYACRTIMMDFYIFKALLDAGSDVNKIPDDVEQPRFRSGDPVYEHHAPPVTSLLSMYSDDETFKFLELFSSYGLNLHQESLLGYTPFMAFSTFNLFYKPKSLQYFLDHGVDINTKSSQGRTALKSAIESHSIRYRNFMEDKVIRFLVDHGAHE